MSRIPEILADLHRSATDPRFKARAVDLLARYDHRELEADWERDPEGPRLYRAFTKRLIDEGYPNLAIELSRRRLEAEAGRSTDRGDPHLRYLVALAFARGGSSGSAERYVLPLVAEREKLAAEKDSLSSDVLALRGRLLKEKCRREPDRAGRARLALEAAGWYLRAADLTDYRAFPLQNAATLHYVAGERAAAERLAREAGQLAEADIAATPNEYWNHATAGEMCLILGRIDECRTHYARAVEMMLARRDRGSLAALLPNLNLLVDAGLPFDLEWIAERIGRVVAFTGHRIDPPWLAGEGTPPRFPNDSVLVAAVGERIAEELERINARFGFCSLANGSDILFAEAMLERRADLQIVLPFAEADFLRQSVDYGVSDPRWTAWADRFRGVLGKLASMPGSVYFATEEPYLGSNGLFGYANLVVQGIAQVRARQFGATPEAVAVIDPAVPLVSGGAKDFCRQWEGMGFPLTTIDLAAVRELVNPPPEARKVSRPAPEPPPELPRPLRAMLFADVAGFSKMAEDATPRFFRNFQSILGNALAEVGKSVVLKNTWGDGVFVVFGSDEGSDDSAGAGVIAAAAFALDLLDRCGRETTLWESLGFKDPNPLRVALHAGPVFEMRPDPVLERTNYFGQHVNRTARIEPITLPGQAYASEQFAALLTVNARDRFGIEFVGVEPLAKGYATAPLYRIIARN